MEKYAEAVKGVNIQTFIALFSNPLSITIMEHILQTMNNLKKIVMVIADHYPSCVVPLPLASQTSGLPEKHSTI